MTYCGVTFDIVFRATNLLRNVRASGESPTKSVCKSSSPNRGSGTTIVKLQFETQREDPAGIEATIKIISAVGFWRLKTWLIRDSHFQRSHSDTPLSVL